MFKISFNKKNLLESIEIFDFLEVDIWRFWHFLAVFRG